MGHLILTSGRDFVDRALGQPCLDDRASSTRSLTSDRQTGYLPPSCRRSSTPTGI